MSNDAAGWVWRFSPYDRAALLIHAAMADSVNDQNDNEFWMTKVKLAAKARCSRSTVSDTVDAMLADGFLELLEDSGGRHASRYRFLFPDVPVVFESRFQPSGERTVARRQPSGEGAPTVRGADSKPSGERTQNPKGTQVEPKTPPVAPPAGGPAKRRHRIPEPFIVDASMREWLKSNPDFDRSIDWRAETAKFADHFRGSGATKLDWVATWRNWMRRASETAPATANGARHRTGTSRAFDNLRRTAAEIADGTLALRPGGGPPDQGALDEG